MHRLVLPWPLLLLMRVIAVAAAAGASPHSSQFRRKQPGVCGYAYSASTCWCNVQVLLDPRPRMYPPAAFSSDGLAVIALLLLFLLLFLLLLLLLLLPLLLRLLHLLFPSFVFLLVLLL